MAYGGGKFVTQNKRLMGSYIRFVSKSHANVALSDRGVAALPLSLDWGVDGVLTVTNEDFLYNSQKIFGYDYAHEKLMGLRDVFKNAQKLYIYKLNSDGVKAANEFAEAKCSGIRGNDLKIVITKNVDDSAKFDVKTYLNTSVIDTQTVAAASELIENDFVKFKADATLAETASTPLTGGTNGETVTVGAWQKALETLEKYSFNIFGAVSNDESVKSLVASWTKRLRDEVGLYFQSVIYRHEGDHEGIINVDTAAIDAPEESAVYWTVGAEAGCKVNGSVSNKIYDGEFKLDTNYTQAQLIEAIDQGKFVFHLVGDDVRVLTDINSFVTTTDEKGDDFKSNQNIRINDEIALQQATIFNTKYLGVVPNNASGRVSLWNDYVNVMKELIAIGAVDESFNPEDLTVAQGETKKSVVVNNAYMPINAMEIMYATNVIA